MGSDLPEARAVSRSEWAGSTPYRASYSTNRTSPTLSMRDAAGRNCAMNDLIGLKIRLIFLST